MAATLLERNVASCVAVPVAVVPDDPGDQEVFAEASRLLGYNPSLKDVETAKEQAVAVMRSNEIRQALVTLDDPPFTAESVAKYKKVMAKRLTTRPWKEWVYLPCCGLVVIGLIVTAFTNLMGLVDVGDRAFASWSMLTVVVAGIVALLLGTKFEQNDLVIIVTRACWNVIPIAAYKRPIPDFAAQTANDLKRRFNDVCFEIEELEIVRNKTVILNLKDPFLVIVLPDRSRYYLEVWNEPSFKGQRMA